MKHTALTDTHIALGAKMVPFAGFYMPVQYEGVQAEHHTVRKGVGVFDVSHMGEFLIEGNTALDIIQKICSNDASKLVDGQAQYSCMPNYTGGVVDDLIVYRIQENKYLLVVNASNIEKDWNWVVQHNQSYQASLKNLSDDYSLLAIQGPKAIEAIQPLTSVNLSAIRYYHFTIADFAGATEVLISATGYTGSGGFEVYCKNNHAQQIWNRIFEAGAHLDIKPIGLAARDTLRLEMGYCLYGNDIDDTTSPIVAGLGWVTKFNKDFINAENLRKEKEQGPSRKLVGFELQDRGIPRHGYEIVDAQGLLLGHVTSGTQSPSLDKGIGLGYVPAHCATPGNDLYINIRKNRIPATIVKPPFYKTAPLS